MAINVQQAMGINALIHARSCTWKIWLNTANALLAPDRPGSGRLPDHAALASGYCTQACSRIEILHAMITYIGFADSQQLSVAITASAAGHMFLVPHMQRQG